MAKQKRFDSEIIVLGMHRSGTSLIAGGLKKMGIDMGKEYNKRLRNFLDEFIQS